MTSREFASKVAAVAGGFFRDADGNLSYARLGSAFCLLASAGAFLVGLHWKDIMEHCHRFINTMTTTAMGLYGSSKAQQTVTSFSPQAGLPKPPAPPAPKADVV